MNLFDCKKGQARNYIAIIIFLVMFGFLSILAFTIHNEFISAYNSTGYYTGPVKTAGDKFSEAFKLYDYMIVLIMAVLLLVVGITSFRLRTHPIFFIITVIEAIFIGFVSYFFNYVFVQLVSDSSFTAVLVYFPRTMLICTNLHWIALVAIVIGSITLYGKRQQGDNIIQEPRE